MSGHARPCRRPRARGASVRCVRVAAVPAGPRRRAVTRLLALATTAFLATGCDGKWVRGGWPTPITQQCEQTMGVWQGAMITAACVVLFVIGQNLASALF